MSHSSNCALCLSSTHAPAQPPLQFGVFFSLFPSSAEASNSLICTAGLEPSRQRTPGRLWFSLDEAKRELWKSLTESSGSQGRAGELGHLQAQTAISSGETGKTMLQDWSRRRPSAEAMQGGMGELGKAP